MIPVLFAAFALVTVACALMVILHRSPVRTRKLNWSSGSSNASAVLSSSV